ncbi:hypothetical protein SAMN05661096_01436 [Marivirga sericea]|uniref:DUF4625 domain-containing protein n=1 Tax=Marivirga sericea TaxID=1028 RepID=A0A1X7J8N6_9BACT|nr:hypothetical protein [Marivirga sericea]SMG24018.1 hypothetical protein SAMN05661096_01436 [Marivirga sericea]
MMKFLKSGLLFAAAGLLVFTACDPAEDETPIGSAPNVTVTVENEQDEYLPGDVIDLVVDFTADDPVVGATINAETEEFILTFDATGISNNVIDLNEFDVASSTEGSFTLSGIQIPNEFANQTLTFTIEMEDGEGRIGEGSLDVEVGEADEPIASFSAILLGAQGNTNPGFVNALSGETATYGEARDASGLNNSTIDFAYYYGNSNRNTIASIDDAGLNAVYEATNPDLSIEDNFGTRNSTRFLITDLSPEDFDNIETNSELVANAESEVTTNSSATQLSEGSVIAFKLDEDRGSYLGLIKVVSIDDTNGNGTITIEVKVQESE